MNGGLINLTDGTRIEAKINFGTMYYLQKSNAAKLAEKMQKKQDKGIEPNDYEKMEFTAKVIYALLRSNGRKVDFDEALSLMPTDPSEMETILEAYQSEMERIKKKQEAQGTMKKFVQK